MDKYKIAFIYGVTDEQRKTEDGELKFYGENIEDSFHSVYLVEFIQEKYPDFKMFQKLNYKHQPEMIAYLLSRVCHHIVFLNTTKDVEKYGKTGTFIMPKDISEKQWETLFLFCDSIPDYQVTINYDIVLVDGLLDSKSLSSTENSNPRSLMESYFRKIEYSKSAKQK